MASPKEEDYFDLKNTTFKVLPPDACVGKQITGLSGIWLADLKHQVAS